MTEYFWGKDGHLAHIQISGFSTSHCHGLCGFDGFKGTGGGQYLLGKAEDLETHELQVCRACSLIEEMLGQNPSLFLDNKVKIFNADGPEPTIILVPYGSSIKLLSVENLREEPTRNFQLTDKDTIIAELKSGAALWLEWVHCEFGRREWVGIYHGSTIQGPYALNDEYAKIIKAAFGNIQSILQFVCMTSPYDLRHPDYSQSKTSRQSAELECGRHPNDCNACFYSDDCPLQY